MKDPLSLAGIAAQVDDLRVAVGVNEDHGPIYLGRGESGGPAAPPVVPHRQAVDKPVAINFCSNCGNRLVRAVPSGDGLERDVCPACQAVHYQNPRVLVTCLATWGQRALWIRRALPPRRGFWSVPGGYTELGESLQQAAARELFEETGVQLPPHELALFGVGSILHVNQVYVSFRAELRQPEYRVTAEAEEVALFSEDELPWEELAFPELTDIIRRFYQELRAGKFGIYMGEYASGHHYLQRMDGGHSPR